MKRFFIGIQQVPDPRDLSPWVGAAIHCALRTRPIVITQVPNLRDLSPWVGAAIHCARRTPFVVI